VEYFGGSTATASNLRFFVWPGACFLLTCLIVLGSGCFLQKSQEVECKFKDPAKSLKWHEKKLLRSSRRNFNLIMTVCFNCGVVPLVKAFVEHIDCSITEGGVVLWYGYERHMDSRPDVVCFMGYHFVIAALWAFALSLYLVVCFLFELLHMNLPAIFMLRVREQPAFPVGTSISTFKVLRVSLSVALPFLPSWHPRVNTGALTPTSYMAAGLCRISMKIVAPVVGVLQTRKPKRQMLIFFILSCGNWFVHQWWPPFRNHEVCKAVLVVQEIVLLGSACALFEVVICERLVPEILSD